MRGGRVPRFVSVWVVRQTEGLLPCLKTWEDDGRRVCLRPKHAFPLNDHEEMPSLGCFLSQTEMTGIVSKMILLHPVITKVWTVSA